MSNSLRLYKKNPRTVWSGQWKLLLHENIPVDMILIFASPELAAQWLLWCPGQARPVSCRPLPRFAIHCQQSHCLTLPARATGLATAAQATGQRSSGLGLQSSSRKLENWKQKYFSLNNSATLCSQLFVQTLIKKVSVVATLWTSGCWISVDTKINVIMLDQCSEWVSGSER